MSLFGRGFSDVEKEVQRQEKARENASKGLWRFFLKDDGDEADIRFLTEEPINFYEHTIKTGDNRYETHICTSEITGSCNFCDEGHKASFKGAFLILDRTPVSYTKNDGTKVESDGQIKLYIQGARVLSQLDRLSKKYGLTNRDYTIARSGKGKSTSYMFDREDESDITTKEIKSFLPDSLRKSFNGTEDSLYTIVEDQLNIMANLDAEKEGDSEDEDTDEEFVSIEDDTKQKSGTLKNRKGSSVKKLFKSKKG